MEGENMVGQIFLKHKNNEMLFPFDVKRIRPGCGDKTDF